MAKLLTVPEVAAYLRCSTDHVHRVIARQVRHTKPARRLLFDQADLDAWLKAQAVEPWPGGNTGNRVTDEIERRRRARRAG
jgi:excisionase family DNA binding protein